MCFSNASIECIRKCNYNILLTYHIYAHEHCPLIFADTYCVTMNFLMRSATSISAERSSIPKPPANTHQKTLSASTLETIVSEDSFKQTSITEEFNRETDGVECENGTLNSLNSLDDLPSVAKHSDVSDEEGWITIPYSMSTLPI